MEPKTVDIEKRNKAILAMASYGILSLQQIGDQFGITRERVRQIFFKLSDTPWMELRDKATEDRRNKFLDRVKYLCAACGKKVTYRKAKGGRKLCHKCRYLRKVEARDPYIILNCDWCGKIFHPHLVRKYMAGITGKYGAFCSAKHYGKYKAMQNGGELND